MAIGTYFSVLNSAVERQCWVEKQKHYLTECGFVVESSAAITVPTSANFEVECTVDSLWALEGGAFKSGVTCLFLCRIFRPIQQLLQTFGDSTQYCARVARWGSCCVVAAVSPQLHWHTNKQLGCGIIRGFCSPGNILPVYQPTFYIDLRAHVLKANHNINSVWATFRGT